MLMVPARPESGLGNERSSTEGYPGKRPRDGPGDSRQTTRHREHPRATLLAGGRASEKLVLCPMRKAR